MRAYGAVLSVHLPSRSRLLLLAEREICKKKILQDYNEKTGLSG